MSENIDWKFSSICNLESQLPFAVAPVPRLSFLRESQIKIKHIKKGEFVTP